MVHGPAVEIKEERADAPLPRVSIGNLRKEDVIKVYHPTTTRWKSVVVKQIRVRSCRIQVCSENEASSSYDKAPGDSLEWLDFSQLRFKMTRKIGVSRSLRMDEEGYTQPHGEPSGKACVTAPDTAGKRTHKIQRGGNLQASVPAPSLKRKKRKKIQKKRSVKALRSATDSEDQNRESQLASSPSPAHSSQTRQEGKDKGDMTEAEAVAVAVVGTDGEVSSNPKVVLGVPINATKKKYMRIVGGHLREADECAVLPPLTPDLTDPEKPLKRAFSHHGDPLSKRCRRLLDFDKTFCEQLCGEIGGTGEEGMANPVSGPDHQKFHFNSSNEHFEGVTVKSVLREIFDLKGQTSSVAHMKESESKQKGKADLYEPLPHIMYRLTYINAESPMTLRTATCLEDCLFPCIACVVATKDAKEAREYILWPNQRLEVLRNSEADACHFQALSVNQLQKHMVDNSCLIVHYQYDQGTLLRACTTEHSIPKSNVQVMMHTKKSSTNSTEINKLATTVSKQMKVSSLGIRLDLFISPDLKSTLGKEELSALTAVVRGFECQLKLAILNWNLETSLAYLTALEEKYESSRSASSCSLAAISTGESRGGIASKDLLSHTRNSWSALNSCSKRILLKTFIDRIHRLGRKVGSLDCDDILAKIRNSDGLLDFIGRNKIFFSKRVLYYISSMLQLMSIDMILTKETNSGHYLFRQFHILNRSNSRDSFTYELVTKKTICRLAKGTDYVRTEYFFPPDAIPDNYRDVVPKSCYDDNLGIYPAGVTTCTDLFSERELGEIEEKILDLERRFAMQILPETCYDQSVNRNWIKRTKTFFGARYLWTKDQTSGQDAERAAGIRVDVPKVPKWVRHHVEEPLVECGVIPENFVNSSAINIYHDGSEGIQSHYDDDTRFSRPIVSLRTFSDSRLSFGTQFFGYVNGSFFVPMPRGGVTVMEENGYAANGIKHSVRPTDMVDKSVAIILRHIHESNLREAQDIFVEESLSWLKDLGLEETSRETNRAVDTTLSSVMESIIKRVEKEDERQRKEEEKQRKEDERQRKEDERQRKREERERKNVQKVIEKLVRECVKSAEMAVREEERQKKREEREQKAIQRTVKSIIRSVEKEVSIQRQVRNVLGDVIKGVVKQAKDA